MHTYSQDLRDQVLRALEQGEHPCTIACRYEVILMQVYRVRDRFEKEGERSNRQQGGKRIFQLTPVEGMMIGDWIKARTPASNSFQSSGGWPLSKILRNTR